MGQYCEPPMCLGCVSRPQGYRYTILRLPSVSSSCPPSIRRLSLQVVAFCQCRVHDIAVALPVEIKHNVAAAFVDKFPQFQR